MPGNPIAPLNLCFPGAVCLCLSGTRQVATSLPHREAGELTATSCPLAWASLIAAGESGCFSKDMIEESLDFSLSTLEFFLELEFCQGACSWKVILVVVERVNNVD